MEDAPNTHMPVIVIQCVRDLCEAQARVDWDVVWLKQTRPTYFLWQVYWRNVTLDRCKLNDFLYRTLPCSVEIRDSGNQKCIIKDNYEDGELEWKNKGNMFLPMSCSRGSSYGCLILLAAVRSRYSVGRRTETSTRKLSPFIGT